MMETTTNFKKFEDLTEEELAEITNGCGGKGSKIVPPYATMFKANCDHHDYGYYKGGNWLDRLKCDYKFGAALLKDSWHGWKVHKTLYFSAWSGLYLAGVRLFGWKFFNYRNHT